MKPENTSAD